MQKLMDAHPFMLRATAVGLAVAISLFGFSFSTAKADISPTGCLANDFTTQLNKSVAVAYDETNPNGATTITYSVDAGNPQNGSSNGCNVDGVTVTLTTPDGVVHTLQTGGSYPVGGALVQVGSAVNYVAHSTDIVAGDLTASATAAGVLHDKIGGTDPFSSGKTLSLSVIHPNTTVTITPSVATTSAGSSVNLAITEHNTGDDVLSNSSVTLTPPGTTLNASSTSFTGGDTNSDGVLGVGETWGWLVPATVNANTTYSAVGNGTDSLGHSVTSPNYPNEAASTTVHVLNTPSIATTLSATSTHTGTAVHDSAVLTGATGTAGGTVTYTAYTDSACTLGAQSAGAKTVVSGAVPNSNPITFNTAGTYNWQAVYSGDANNAPATSTCQSEPLVVNSFTASMTTAIHQGATDNGTPVVVATSTLAGSTVHDSAALAFGGPTPTGTVDFTFFDTAGNCDSHSVAAGSAAINGSGVADPSSAEGPLAPGSYAFRAHWAGDTNYPAGATSACELLTVAQQQPSISTKLSQISTTTGVAVHDSATLTGTTGTPGGTAVYTVYTDNQCSVGAQAAGTVTVTNGTVPDSNPITFNTAGTYYWQVAYSGDVNNKAATSTCRSEVLTVGKFAPSISTTLSANNVSTSTPVHDSATLSGASSDASGTAAYSVFTNPSCSAGVMSAGVKTVASGVIPDSDPLTFATPGTYYWQVAYSGDIKNAAATSTCAREVLTVATPPPAAMCQDDWKFVGNGWVNFGPIVYLNQGGRLLNPNNPCPITSPLQFSPVSPSPTTTATTTTPPRLDPDRAIRVR